MRPGSRAFLALLLGLTATAGFQGCATAEPMHSKRVGLLERLMESDHHYDSDRGALTHPQALAEESGDDRARVVESAPHAKLLGLQWPLRKVVVTSPFGRRGRDFHEGIDLRAATGTTVYAAQAGTVIYADRKISGYGKMIVVRHGHEFATIYAHNSKILVRPGQKVKLGQKIAISGKTGHVNGPHLHFEIRHGQAAVDPLLYLPQVSSRLTALNK